MPEGDTVWGAARSLRAALAGQVIVRSDLRVPAHATADLRGWQVADVVSAGKHLLMRLHQEPQGQGVTLHTHLGMDGRWRVYSMRSRPHVTHRTRVILQTATCVAVGNSLPVVELLPTSEEHRIVDRLGPDCLGENWDIDTAVANLAAAPQRNIGHALLDQRNLAGVGNVYRSEVLFLRGIHPRARAGDVADLHTLVATAADLLTANRERTTRNTTGLLGRGRELFVYGRSGRPCLRCASTVLTADLPADKGETGQRVVYWCPRCQPTAGN